MNTLSWLIYFIHIVDTLQTWCTAIIAFGMVVTLVTLIASAIHDDDYRREVPDRWLPIWRKWASRFAFIVLPICVVLQIVLPSRQTLLLIASSEMGERLLQSSDIKSGTNLLRLWIEKETTRIAKEIAGQK